MKVIPRLGVLVPFLAETTKNVSSGRKPISVQSAKSANGKTNKQTNKQKTNKQKNRSACRLINQTTRRFSKLQLHGPFEVSAWGTRMMLYLIWDWLHQQSVRCVLSRHDRQDSSGNVALKHILVRVLSPVYRCCGNILVLSKLERSRISKYHRRNNRKFYQRYYFRPREDFFGRPLPGEEISESDFLSLNCLH